MESKTPAGTCEFYMKEVENYLIETINIIGKIDTQKIFKISHILKILEGRLFVLGVGGSAASASHAVNDFRKIMNIEAYAPTDNISEFSARINDDGWNKSFVEYLKTSKLNSNDCIMILSGSGGNDNKSENILEALEYARIVGARIIGIVGGNGGYTAIYSDVCILIPTVNKDRIYPHTEELHSIICHLLVTI